MKYLCFVCFLLFVISISCRRSSIENDLSTPKMDPEYFEILFNSTNVQTTYSKDIIDTVIYLPLETNASSEFSQVSQLEVTEKYYLILDKEANAIFFFNKDGSYSKKISPSNRDVPVPFKRVLRFTVDPSLKLISFNDIHSDNIYVFDSEGGFIRMIKKTDWHYFRDDFSLFDGYELSLDLFNGEDRGKTYPSVIVRKDSIDKFNALSYDPNVISYDEVVGLEQYFYRSSPDYLLITRPYDYAIYKFDRKNMISEYAKVIFPTESRLPNDFLHNGMYKTKRNNYIKNNPSVKYSLSDVYETERQITFRSVSSSFLQFFIFDKSKNMLFDGSRHVSDSTTLYMPIFGHKIYGADNNFFISAMSAAHVIQSISRFVGHEYFINNRPASLKKIFEKGNNQNPVLLLTKFND